MMQALSQKKFEEKDSSDASARPGRWIWALIAALIGAAVVAYRLVASTLWWSELAAPGKIWRLALEEGGVEVLKELWRFQRDFGAAIWVGMLSPDPAWFALPTALFVGIAILFLARWRGWELLPALGLAFSMALLLPLAWMVSLLPLLLIAEFFRSRSRVVVAKGCELTVLLLIPFTTPTLPAAGVAALFFLGRRFPPVGLPLAALLAVAIRVSQPEAMGSWPLLLACVAALLAGLLHGWALQERTWQERCLQGAGAAVLVLIFPPLLPLGWLMIGRLPRLQKNQAAAGVALLVLFLAATYRMMPDPQNLQLSGHVFDEGRQLAASLEEQPAETLYAGRGELWVLGFEPELAKRIVGWPHLIPVLLENESMLASPEAFLTASPPFDQALFSNPMAETSELVPFLAESVKWPVGDLNAAGLWMAPNLPESTWKSPTEPPKKTPILLAREATWLQAVGEGSAARQALEAAAAVDPVPSEVHLRRARYFVSLQRMGESLQEAEEVLQRHPGNPAALSIKAQVLFGAKEYSPAYDASARLVEVSPNDPSALWLHAKIAHQVKNYSAEARMLKRLIALETAAGADPTYKTVLLGQAYARDGDAKRALRYLNQALESPTITPPLQRRIEETKALIKRRVGVD